MKDKTRWYYSALDKLSQSVYDDMYEGFSAIAPSFKVRRLDAERLSRIFALLRLDNPSVFYVPTFSYRAVREAEWLEIVPKYMFEKTKIRDHQKAMASRTEKLLRPARGYSEAEKERFVHDFICSGVTYDKLEKDYSHEIIGPLGQGVGVCEGIAKTVKHLLDELGVECIVVIGEAGEGSRYRHAWNVVRLNGQWYHVDATFDNSLGRYGQPRFDYYNLSDGHIFRDHREAVYPVPSCGSMDLFYYKTAGLSFTTTEQVRSRAAQFLRKKKDGFVFHWRGGGLGRAVLCELMEAITAEAQKKNKFAALSVNFAQAVVKVSFADAPAAAAVESEQADEASDAPRTASYDEIL